MSESVVISSASPNVEQAMKTPEDVTVMMRLKKLGWGNERIAKELGISKNTVKRYVRNGGWVGYRRVKRTKQLDGMEEWVNACFLQHQGNAEVVRQELKRQRGIEVSLRTVERMVAGLRRSLKATVKATVRFETPPGQQLQIDFGESKVTIGEVQEKVHLFVATLGYSRRIYVAAFRSQGQASWLEGLERTFLHFAGVPEEVLIDNAKALVAEHHMERKEVRFNERFQAFAVHWGFKPRACAPYRARTKGKDERAVQYVKRNAIAGRTFESWGDLESHLAGWTRDVADQRVHGTTWERPIERFEKERAALKRLQGRPSFIGTRTYLRKVSSDALVDLETDRYSVPWAYVGSQVEVGSLGGFVHIRRDGQEIARHPMGTGNHELIQNTAHYEGIFRKGRAYKPAGETTENVLARDLSVYEQLAGGAF